MVNDDAVKLKTLTDQAVAKYLCLPLDELRVALSRDFPGGLYNVERDLASFVFDGMDEFLFILHADAGKAASDRALSVQGRGKYYGFNWYIAPGGQHCSVSDGIFHKATGGAKKLVQVMKKKFGISDLSKLLNRFR
jgi:hypothetical protein